LNLQHQHKTSHFQLLASRRGESPGRRRLVSLSFSFFFPFLFYLIFFFSSCYFVITLLLFLCRFRAAFALWYFTWILFFLVWLYSIFFEGRRILGYSGRAFDSVEVSRIPGSSRILESTDQNCGRIPRFWVFESLDSRILGNSEISRSPSPTILRHSIFGILNLQILGFSNPWILRSPRILESPGVVEHLTPRRCK